MCKLFMFDNKKLSKYLCGLIIIVYFASSNDNKRFTAMKATYNKSKIMRNAWYLKRANASMSFSACLKKAWRNEKLAILTAKIENRPTEQPKATEYRPQLLTVPADYYGNSRTYYGD